MAPFRMTPAGKKGHASGCPIANSLDLLGDRWTLLVLRDLLFGGRKRFSDFLASAEGIATNVLSERLKRLEKAGLVVGTKDPRDGRSIQYDVTPKGEALLPVLLELIRWGAAHDPDTRTPREFVARLEQDREAVVADILGGRKAPPG